MSRLPSVVVQLGAAGARPAPAPDETERAALRGERAAWNELIARHERRVVLSLLAAGVAPAQAREFCHDAWLRLMQQASAGRLEYLQLPGLVVRQALFLARADARRPGAAPPAESNQAEADTQAASAEVVYFVRERLERARACVERLPPSARQVFLTLYREPQLSHGEVATLVGLSVQRVRQILCEVRKTLRAQLDEEVPGVPPRSP